MHASCRYKGCRETSLLVGVAEGDALGVDHLLVGFRQPGDHQGHLPHSRLSGVHPCPCQPLICWMKRNLEVIASVRWAHVQVL